MTPENCPGCGIKLRPDMLACPNCPMSFPEDDGPPTSVNPLKQSPYYQFVMPALFFGAIGAVVWYLGIGLMRLGEKNAVIENGNIFGDAPKKAPVSASPSQAASEAVAERTAAAMSAPVEDAPAPASDGGLVVISKADSAPAPAPAPTRARAAAAPSSDEPPKPVREWRLRGAVYDLTSLKPLAGAFLSFKDEQSNKEVMTRTDSTGHYRALVPALGGRGYAVTIERSGYAPNYLDPATENVPQLPAERRRGLAHDLAGSLTAPPALVQSSNERPLITDFYLAPRL
jgi:hypothetical protein